MFLLKLNVRFRHRKDVHFYFVNRTTTKLQILHINYDII